MSPEQAEMNAFGVDTRSDIYSLGVLLYELLTGTTPLDKDRLKQAAFDEIRRIIREEEPPRPSTRLSTMNEQARSLSATQRHSDPKSLGRLVHGELDWIVMKALEKQRHRRYESYAGADVQRHLVMSPSTMSSFCLVSIENSPGETGRPWPWRRWSWPGSRAIVPAVKNVLISRHSQAGSGGEKSQAWSWPRPNSSAPSMNPRSPAMPARSRMPACLSSSVSCQRQSRVPPMHSVWAASGKMGSCLTRSSPRPAATGF
jgi:serine/threonine protein kinase